MTKKYMFAVLILLTALAISLVLSIVRARASPGSISPEWMYAGCYEYGSITVGWYNPPDEVLPFDPWFPAYMTVYSSNGTETEIMTYYGSSTCPLYPGCVVYRWRATYDIPGGDYYVEAYVVNMKGDAFYVQPEKLYPGCNQDDTIIHYLPIILMEAE